MSIGRLGVLGGTFDPIHFGHLDAGDAAQAALGLDVMRLIPSRDPPHRPTDPRASAFHRFALVALAIQDRPSWRVSDAELVRQGPSYTFDTLRALQHEGWDRSQIFFILGADAFAEIATWHRFPAVLDEANFVVVARPGVTLDAAVARTPGLRSRMRGADRVHDTIRETGIFLVEGRTRDVSSSEIRARLGAGIPIDDLVPAAVSRYVAANQLYSTGRAVGDLHGEEQRTHD
jgi:nicotinate-nucleotide adenylyltransferase